MGTKRPKNPCHALYIVASSSRYGSPTFTVKKKDGTLRIVHDYRRLNEFTVMDVTPLPCISSILEELRGKALFSKFNIRAGYNNIRIRTEDTYKTGFKTNKGLYEWIVMPFGLCTAPATFTRMLNEILRPLTQNTLACSDITWMIVSS